MKLDARRIQVYKKMAIYIFIHLFCETIELLKTLNNNDEKRVK
jgi:hypothetical protein